MQRNDVVDLAPPEAQIAFVREPGPHLKKTFGLVGASSDRQALIFCHTQLYLVRASSIEAFRVERLLPAKGGGGSYLDVICRTGEADCPTKRLRIHSADEPETLNDFGAELAGFFGAPFQLPSRTRTSKGSAKARRSWLAGSAPCRLQPEHRPPARPHGEDRHR